MGKNYLSYTMALTLQAIENGYGYGFDVMAVTGLASGTVYPALRRLENADYASKWERQSIAQAEQRPPRKYYEVIMTGPHRPRRSTSAFSPLVPTRTSGLQQTRKIEELVNGRV